MTTKTKAVICRLDESLFQRLEELAAKEDRYPAQQLIQLLRRTLADDTSTDHQLMPAAGR